MVVWLGDEVHWMKRRKTRMMMKVMTMGGLTVIEMIISSGYVAIHINTNTVLSVYSSDLFFL